MNLNEFDKTTDETPRKKRPTVLRVLIALAVIALVAVITVNVWPNGKDKNDSFSHQNDIIFYNPTDDNGSFDPPTPTTPPTPEDSLVCSTHINACATQRDIDAEIARMTSELAERGLPIGSPDVTVRDTQMSHIITDVCYQPTEGTYLAGESLWGDVWVNTPQTNRPMRFMSALSSVCSDELDMLQGYLRPKNPYEDPSYNGNVPSMPPSEYTPPMPPTVNEGSTHTPTPPESAPSTGERDYN